MGNNVRANDSLRAAGEVVGLLDIAGDDHEVSKEAIRVTQRIQMKLNGRDFPSPDGGPISVEDQVDLLIKQARSHENLAQHYSGWCAFW